jgi:hypothetical protein
MVLIIGVADLLDIHGFHASKPLKNCGKYEEYGSSQWD